DATRCPASSSVRASSRRLTLLSSTSSRRPPCPSATRQFLERLRNARVFGRGGVDRRRGCAPDRRKAAQFELARELAERQCAERVRIRLERMRGAAEALGIVFRIRVAQLVEHARGFGEKRVDELADEFVTRRFHEAIVGRAIDRGQVHWWSPHACGFATALPPAGAFAP